MQLSVFVPSRALARRLAILTLLVGGTEAVLLGLGGLLLPSEWFKVVYCTNLPAGAVSAMMIYVGWGRAYLLGCLNAYAVSALAALGAAALKRLACSIVLALRASSMGLAVPDTCGWEGAKLDPFVAFMLMFGTSIGWFSIALQEWKARRDQQRG